MYKIKNIDGLFSLIEVKTENVIDTCKQFATVSKLKMRLEKGKGFNGWTPSFFLNKYIKGGKNEQQNNIQTENTQRHSAKGSKKKSKAKSA